MLSFHVVIMIISYKWLEWNTFFSYITPFSIKTTITWIRNTLMSIKTGLRYSVSLMCLGQKMSLTPPGSLNVRNQYLWAVISYKRSWNGESKFLESSTCTYFICKDVSQSQQWSFTCLTETRPFKRSFQMSVKNDFISKLWLFVMEKSQ